jgi:hypothetical protein
MPRAIEKVRILQPRKVFRVLPHGGRNVSKLEATLNRLADIQDFWATGVAPATCTPALFAPACVHNNPGPNKVMFGDDVAGFSGAGATLAKLLQYRITQK